MTDQDKPLFENEHVSVMSNGDIAIKCGEYSRRMSPEMWDQMAKEHCQQELVIRDLERKVNERTPHRFIPELLKKLSDKEERMKRVENETSAGLLCMGQAQGTRDAIQCIKSHLPELDLYTQW